MRTFRFDALIGFGLSLLLAGCNCGGGGQQTFCQAGATQSCFCSDGRSGSQTCGSDGSAFGACVCTGPIVDSGQPPAPDAGCTSCNGACVYFESDKKNCGSCGTDCTALPNVDDAGVYCEASSCQLPPSACASGFGHCNGSVSDGCETDLTTNSNCGGCGITCAADGGTPVCTSVANGVWACTSGCGNAPPTKCNGVCKDLQDDVTNCGACGNDCTALANVIGAAVDCRAGVCVIPPGACQPGYGNCNTTVGDGCETQTTTASACGACGISCSADAGTPNCSQLFQGGYTCTAACTGATPQSCDAGCANIQNDVANCGACARDCRLASNAGTGAVCAAGTCAFPTVGGCAVGFADCDGNPANGCEADITQTNRCGACNTSCSGTNASCVQSGNTFSCQNGCSGATPNLCSGACTNFQTDTNNCGSCGFNCAALPHVTGAVACVGGACVVPPSACQPGYRHCTTSVNDGCETNITLPSNCGSCGNACDGGSPLCSAAQGYTCAPACSGATPTDCNGSCVSLLSSNGNCGACGNSCTGGTTCVGGVCTCPGGYANCGNDGGVSSGCRDINNDVNACGACGNVCVFGQTCNAGVCTCLGGRTVCDGTCVDRQIDSTNCGTCGTVCTGGQTCQSGACACLPGQKLCNGTCRSVTADNNNCGFCGAVCQNGEVCSAGACTQPALTQIDIGSYLACALRNSGQLACWGQKASLNLNSSNPVVLNAPVDATQIAVGDEHLCAIVASGQVRCMGTGTSGQLGNSASANSPTPVTVTGLTGILQISAGFRHTCALRADRTVACWGDNAYGALGDTTTNTSNFPVTVTGLVNVQQVVAGYYTTCALQQNGEVRCWGYNGNGQLGDGTSVSSRATATTVVSGITNGSSLGAGPYGQHFCAVLLTGQVRCWGYGTSGQLGNAGNVSSNIPVNAFGITDGVAVDLDNAGTCVLRASGELACFGANSGGQFGNGTLVGSNVPTPGALERTDLVEVTMGYLSACVRRSSGVIECFGENSYGQLGNGESRIRTSPVRVNSYCGAGQTNCSGFCFDLQADAANCGACGTACGAGLSCNNGVCGCGPGLTNCGGTCRNLSNDPSRCGACSGTGATCAAGQVCANGGCTTLAVSGLEAAGTLTCARENTGAIRCWGTGAGVSTNGPVLINSPNDAVSVGLGNGFNCAVRRPGRVVCWGGGTSGQLGNGASVDSATPVEVKGLTDAVQVAAGYRHACALRSNGRLVCWGDNAYGALGDGTTVNANAPVPVTFLTDVVEVTAGYYTTCARRSGNSVVCWGYNGNGNLGDGNSASARPLANTPVQFISDAVSISANANAQHACAVRSSGAVSCWGYGTSGQLGNGSNSSSNFPVNAQGVTDATQVTVGDNFTCARRSGGSVVCWGANNNGAFGNGRQVGSNVPVPAMEGVTDAVRLAAGSSHTCLTRTDNSIFCTGNNSLGELGDGDSRQVRTTVVEVKGYCSTGETNCSGACYRLQSDTSNCGFCGTGCAVGQACNSGVCGCGVGLTDCSGTCRNLSNDPAHCGACSGGNSVCAAGQVCANGVCSAPVTDELAAKDNVTCALSNGGSLRCWGQGNGVTSSVPVVLNAPTDATTIAVGGGHSCAVRNSGQTVCWGANSSGQLGDGTITASVLPVVVKGVPGSAQLTGAVQLAAGFNHTCALLNSGRVACWGDNSYGALGDGTTSPSRAPVLVTGLTDAVQVAAGYYATCARRATNEITCWGYNGNGNLGDASTASSRPLAGPLVVGIADATWLSGLGQTFCAARSTGGVSCWGYGTSGQLGNNGTSSSNTPVAVVNLVDAERVAVSETFACALRTNDRIACWGANSSGQFGNGTMVGSLIATSAATGLTDAQLLAVGAAHGCAVKSDGSIRCWGDDSLSQLGDVSARVRTTPVQVAGYCAAGETNCSGTCTTVATDPANCGSCGNPCAPGEACNGGVCGCGVGLTDCSGTCRNLSNDPQHCGGCTGAGTSCTTGLVCSNSSCSAPAVIGLSSYGSLSCATRNSGAVQCWGSGIGVASNQPVTLGAPSDARSTSVGSTHACSVRNGGQVVCWGGNGSGQLGNGTTQSSTIPVAVSGLSNASIVSAGYNHSCAVLNNGQVWCWGDNSYGALGDGSTSASNAPVLVTGITDATRVVAGYYTTCVLRTGNTVVCFGYNGNGNLGDGQSASSRPLATLPVQFINDAVNLSGSQQTFCALRSSGAVSCWGLGSSGQLGNAASASSNVPVNVTGLSDAAAISVHDTHACAARSGGAVVCWGANASGQWGNSGTTSVNQATAAFTGIGNAMLPSAGASFSCVLRTDGAISCAGNGTGGELGNSASASSSSPVPVTGFP